MKLKFLFFIFFILLLIPNVYSLISVQGTLINEEGNLLREDVQVSIFSSFKDTYGQEDLINEYDGSFEFLFDDNYAGQKLVLGFQKRGSDDIGDIYLPGIEIVLPFNGNVNLGKLTLKPYTIANQQSEVTGTVFDASNFKPLQNVRVEALHTTKLGVDKDTVTNFEGRFSLFLDELGDYRLLVSREGYLLYENYFKVKKGSKDLITATLDNALLDVNFPDIRLVEDSPSGFVSEEEFVLNSEIIRAGFAYGLFIKENSFVENEYSRFKASGQNVYKFPKSPPYQYPLGFRVKIKHQSLVYEDSLNGKGIALRYNFAYDDGSGQCSRAVVRSSKSGEIKF